MIFFLLPFQACSAAGGKCETRVDGYYFEVVICLVYGVLWYFWGKTKIERLQKLPVRSWRVVQDGARAEKDNGVAVEREQLLRQRKNRR